MVFCYPPKNQKFAAQVTLIGYHNNRGFFLFMDNYIGAAIFFEAMFYFLHYYYFPCTIFGPVYLASHKTFVFTDQLDFVGFIRDKNKLRPSIKYKKRINHWSTPMSRKKVETFLWLTLFLRYFISG